MAKGSVKKREKVETRKQYKLNFLRIIFKPLWKSLTNDTYCYRCEKEYKNDKDKQKCRYCGKYFCSNDIIPKDHSENCHKLWKILTNDVYCWKCETKFTNSEEKHRCKYCSKYFCSYHIRPINHDINCKIQSNGEYCWKCGKAYSSWTNSHTCRYCGWTFCADHWVPESHSCAGHPDRPKGSVREIHRAGGRVEVYGK